jgi:hypothetical protein
MFIFTFIVFLGVLIEAISGGNSSYGGVMGGLFLY